MDIDARLEALTQSLELAVSLHNDLEKKTAKIERQFAKTDRQLAETDRRLRRAIAAGVKEMRHERQMRRDVESRFDRKMAQLAAAQLVTEEKLKGLIDSLR